jgi:hypothetical protein
MFLEPLFTGGLNQAKTLAHEVSVSFRGQQVIGDDRVIPQAEQTVGGLYTVRGYAESTSVGDNGQVWSAEYRFHVPQVFEPQPTAGELVGQPFRWAPQAERGRADWDVVLKTFIDYGRVTNNRIAPGERVRTCWARARAWASISCSSATSSCAWTGRRPCATRTRRPKEATASTSWRRSSIDRGELRE